MTRRTLIRLLPTLLVGPAMAQPAGEAPRRYLKAAVDAAAWIKSHEVATEAGKTWPIATGSKRNMPNFSHGTAGVAYFLATLYEQTREKEFLDAAVLGGRYLTSVADARHVGAEMDTRRAPSPPGRPRGPDRLHAGRGGHRHVAVAPRRCGPRPAAETRIPRFTVLSVSNRDRDP